MSRVYQPRSGKRTAAAEARLRRGVTLRQIAALVPGMNVQRLWGVEAGYAWYPDAAALLGGFLGQDQEELFPWRHGGTQFRHEGEAWIGGEPVDREAARGGEWAERAAIRDPGEDMDRAWLWREVQRRVSARDAAVVLDYSRGWTLQEIADVLGVSRERVRQIVGRVGDVARAIQQRQVA